MSQSSWVCTLFWPPAQCAVHRLSPPSNDHEDQSFLIGWNPRGFVVSVARIIVARSIDAVEEYVHRLATTGGGGGDNADDDPAATAAKMPRGLRILGRLVTGRSQLDLLNDNEDPTTARLRQQADLWLDVSSSSTRPPPTAATTSAAEHHHHQRQHVRLLSLSMCGYRLAAELHLIHLTSDEVVPVTPVILSPMMRLSVSNVMDIVGGRNATVLLRGAQSVLEGPILPPHAANLMQRFTADGAGGGGAAAAVPTASTNSSRGHLPSAQQQRQPQQRFPIGAHQQQQHPHHQPGDGEVVSPTQATNPADSPTLQATRPPPPPNGSLSGSGGGGAAAVSNSSLHNGSIHDISNDSLTTDTTALLTEETPCEISASELDPAVPPRLQYPTAASFTDFSRVMECVAAGAALRTQNRRRTVSVRRQYPHFTRRFTAFFVALLTPLLMVVSRLSRVSYVLALLEYKVRECINALSILASRQTTAPTASASASGPPSGSSSPSACCGSQAAVSCGLHPIIPHRFSSQPREELTEQRRCLRNFVCRLLGDVLVGVLLCTVLQANRAPIVAGLGQAAWYGLHDMHRSYFEWFLGWPAGFKTNDDLTRFLGLWCNAALSGFEWLVVDLGSGTLGIRWVDLGYTGLQYSALFGASFAVSWVADVCYIVTLHLRNMFHVLAIPYRLLLKTVSCLFRQFRGKKFNPLRKRMDEGSFATDEMLLGMTLGTLAAFLWPSLGLYYFYLATARAICWLLQEFLRGLAVLLCHQPIYLLYLWVCRRHALSNGVALSLPKVWHPPASSSPTLIDAAADDSPALPTIEFELVAKPMAFGDIFKELRVLAKVLFSATFSPSRIISFIVHADMKPIIDVPNKVFKHLVDSPENPTLQRK